MQQQRDPNKLSKMEMLALGVGSAALTTIAEVSPLFTNKVFNGYPYYALAAPLVTTAVDYFANSDDVPLMSKRYAKSLGVSAVGTAVATAGLAAAAWIYFKYFFRLNVGF